MKTAYHLEPTTASSIIALPVLITTMVGIYLQSPVFMIAGIFLLLIALASCEIIKTETGE
jgi:hypothetical protein